jgi:acyl-CoA thioester hydrolase
MNSITHMESFRVRSYECDLYGHVNNAVYLRYLQETALGLSAAAGFGVQRLAELGLRAWVPYIDIEYLQPLYYGETVEVLSRPAGWRGDSLRQAHEFRKAGTGELAARAVSETIFLNREAVQMRSIPPEVRAAFFPTGGAAPENAGEPLPPAPPPGVFTTRACVDWQDANAARQVEPAMLLAYVEDCGRQVVAAHGWPMERMLAEGFAILLRRNRIEYPHPAVFGDELELATWVSDVRRATATRYYTIVRVMDGKSLARIQALGVWVNLSTGQPMRVPPALLADFAPNIAA